MLFTRISFVVLLICGLQAYSASPAPIPSPEEKAPWVADPSSKSLSNPEKNIKKSSKKGKKIFAERCVVCHGETGKGDGPGGRVLDPRPADLSSAKVQSQEDGELFWKISEGRLPMITWKLILSEKDRWHLVNFVRSLKKE